MKSFSIVFGLAVIFIAAAFLSTPARAAFADEDSSLSLPDEDLELKQTENPLNEEAVEASEAVSAIKSMGQTAHESFSTEEEGQEPKAA